jgi:hypothetical protein
MGHPLSQDINDIKMDSVQLEGGEADDLLKIDHKQVQSNKV